jgi:precorrin-8X/cobalt-precorrin-8 methylmutase
MNTDLIKTAGHPTREIDPELVRRCIEPGAVTPEAMTIAEEGRAIAQKIVGGDGPEDMIRQRCVVATGDPTFKDLLEFKHNSVKAGLDALSTRAPIYTDIRMVQTGIIKTGHDCKVQCVLDSSGSDALAKELGITRASAGFLTLEQDLQDSIAVIGNAPSAAITLCRIVEYGIKPALIIAVPVGFVNAARSKELIRELDVPSISCTGTRGGTPVAVACINELIVMSSKKKSKM